MATMTFTSRVTTFKQARAGASAPMAVPAPNAPPATQPEATGSLNAFEQFSLTPLTAGDIIDRAVRLYRQHFLVFLRIVLAPSLIAYAGGILWALGARNFSVEYGDQRVLLTLVLMGGGGLLWLAGKALFLMLLGGASRGLVWHFFDGTQLSARAAFAAVRERWVSLLGATVLVSVMLLMMLMIAYMVISFALLFYVFVAVWLLTSLPSWLQAIAHLLFALVAIAGGLLLMLFTYARVVYVPQALMVEGKGVFEALTRSFHLAGREIKRIGALLLFQVCVAMALYWLLMIPLGWYAYWNGLEMGWFSAQTPLWFNIAQQTLAQIGEILIAPIVLLGFTLLYLDTRVRKEGFDVELLANRVFPQALTTYTPAPSAASNIAWTDPQPPVARTTGASAESTPATGAAVPSALVSAAVTTTTDAEASETIPLAQPAEFAEVVPLTVAPAEPAVETVNITFAEQAPQQIAQQVAPRFCSQCGVPQAAGAAFCLQCGAAI